MNLAPEKSNAAAATADLPDRMFAEFAETSLRLFAAEGAFPMVVPQGQDLARTAAAFELRGCVVAKGPEERWITVKAVQP